MSAQNIGKAETPDERRERIDAARREQAGLLREIGQEYSGIAIRPSAMEAWRHLNLVIAQAKDEDVPRFTRCKDKAEKYLDYDAFSVPSPARAKMMCEGCLAVAECSLYAEVAKPAWGVYGKMVYGRDLADKERREFLREEVQRRKLSEGEQA